MIIHFQIKILILEGTTLECKTDLTGNEEDPLVKNVAVGSNIEIILGYFPQKLILQAGDSAAVTKSPLKSHPI